jgi:hypothetical protein
VFYQIKLTEDVMFGAEKAQGFRTAGPSRGGRGRTAQAGGVRDNGNESALVIAEGETDDK